MHPPPPARNRKLILTFLQTFLVVCIKTFLVFQWIKIPVRYNLSKTRLLFTAINHDEVGFQIIYIQQRPGEGRWTAGTAQNPSWDSRQKGTNYMSKPGKKPWCFLSIVTCTHSEFSQTGKRSCGNSRERISTPFVEQLSTHQQRYCVPSTIIQQPLLGQDTLSLLPACLLVGISVRQAPLCRSPPTTVIQVFFK